MKDKEIEIKRGFWDNGNVMYEVPYNKNGNRHGLLIRYNSDSTIWFETTFKHNVEHGVDILFEY